MTSLTRHDIYTCVNRLPKELLDLMKEEGPRITCAGGYVRACVSNEKINDIDLFVASKKDAENYAYTLRNERRRDSRIVKTDNAITVFGYKVPIQFIHRWTFERPQDVVPSFDFTIASAAFWYDTDPASGLKEIWKSLCHESFYPDLASKRLVYLSPVRNEDAGGSMLRVLKFYQQGFRIPLDSLGKVMGRMLRGVPEKNFIDRKGMENDAWESQIGAIMTGLLREVDPLIDPDHIMHLPSMREANEALDGKEVA